MDIAQNVSIPANSTTGCVLSGSVLGVTAVSVHPCDFQLPQRTSLGLESHVIPGVYP